LDAAGGYLALVRPDGATIASQFSYLKQRTDVSYGMSREINPVPLIRAGAPMRVLVPTNSAPGWTGVAEPFNDLAWLRATNGVGFDQSTNSVAGLAGLNGWWDFNDASDPALAPDVSGAKHHAIIRGGP